MTIRKVLILAANPLDTARLRLDKEVKEIRTTLEQSPNRDRFTIEPRGAVSPQDLQGYLFNLKPQIVHFSGHGDGDWGLAFEDENGNVKAVSTEALADLFKLFAKQIQCVVLNACYAAVQAEAICQHIPYAIGMNQVIGDEAARKFAEGFYRAIWDDRTIEDAFASGVNAIKLEGISENLTPVLLKQSDFLPQENIIINPVDINPVDLDEPEGQVPLDSPMYVERPPNEAKCYEAIIKAGALIRIKAPRQMGKSSLMLRILSHASDKAYQVASLNFQLVERDSLSNLDSFLQWFCNSITAELNLEDRLAEYWKGSLGSKNKCTNYFQRYLLPELKEPIVLCLDEVDQVFEHVTIATDFFGMLRAWHEEAKIKPIWKNLRLVIVHSKEVYIPLNINQSPFNVGIPIELPQLTRSQVVDLAVRHGLNWVETEVTRLMQMVGGHPYLVRMALYLIAREEISLDDLLRIAPTEGGIYGEHLRRHLLNLEGDAKLVAAIKQVVAAGAPVSINTGEAFKLASMGLVCFQGNNVVPLCDLYRRYFCDRLGR